MKQVRDCDIVCTDLGIVLVDVNDLQVTSCNLQFIYTLKCCERRNLDLAIESGPLDKNCLGKVIFLTVVVSKLSDLLMFVG